MKKTLIVILIFALTIIALFLFQGETADEDVLEDVRTYTHESPTFSFTIPDNLTLIENSIEDRSGVVVSLSLFEIDEYEMFLESTEAREGPPAITLEVLDAKDIGGPEDWIMGSPYSNYREDTEITETEIAQNPALGYRWTGLYEGYSLVTKHDDVLYIWSVQFFTEEDALRSTFDEIVTSFSL